MFNVTKTYSPLYKRDTMGRIRIWFMQTGTNGVDWAHCTTSGLVDGEKVTSGWKTVSEKNVGRANSTTAEEQAHSEVDSLYTKQRDKAYFDDVNAVDSFEKFKPMLASDYAKRGVDWDRVVFAQPKLDGMRCVARADGLWSRGAKPIVSVPHVAEALETVFEEYPGLVVDGELYNDELSDDFNTIMSLCRKSKPTASDLRESREKVQYHVYDLYDSNNPNMTFAQRFEMLKNVVESLNDRVVVVVKTRRVENQARLDELFADWVESGHEGQILRYDTAYENKRSRNLLKRKDFNDSEFRVLRVEEGQGNWAGHVKRFVVDVDGVEVGCGVRGNQNVLRDMWLNKVKPDWAKVQYFGRTADGSLRFPVVVDYGHGSRND